MRQKLKRKLETSLVDITEGKIQYFALWATSNTLTSRQQSRMDVRPGYTASWDVTDTCSGSRAKYFAPRIRMLSHKPDPFRFTSPNRLHYEYWHVRMSLKAIGAVERKGLACETNTIW